MLPSQLVAPFVALALYQSAPTLSEVPSKPVPVAQVSSHRLDAPTLTFAEALKQADRQSPDLEVARARLKQANTLTAQAWSGYLPQLKAQGGYTYNNVDARLALPTRYGVRDTGVIQGAAEDPNYPGTTPTTAIAVPVESIEVPVQVQNQLNGQVSVSQALLVPELFPAIQSAYLGKETAALTVRNARREILFGVANAYLGAAAMRESIAVQEELLQVRRSFERDAEARFTMGDAAKTAVLRARLDRSKAEQELVRVKNAYLTAKSALAALLARPLDFDVQRPDERELVALSGAAEDTDRLEDMALEFRLDYAASKLGVATAYANRKRALMGYFPSLVATGNLNAANFAGFTGQNVTWNVGLGLSWNLFDGGLREAKIREASAKIAEAKAAERASQEKVKDEARKARASLDTAEATLRMATEQVKVARETAKLANSNFAAGAATYLEVTDANSQLSGAELALVSETLNLSLSRLSLARALGTFEPETQAR